MKRILMTSALATTLTAGSLAATTTISDVEVDVDLDAIKTYEAAKVWSDLPTDLAAALVLRLNDRIDEDGMTVKIDIDEVALANSFESAIGQAESSLAGRVQLLHGDDTGIEGKNYKTYDLSVTAEQVVAFYPDGFDTKYVAVDSDEYYAAVVSAFADNVASQFE
ncbi:hypothetical protein ASD8599_02735 [Ascidiaceihabitans donghaensis]|uniref:Uncharacterized protein n=1 Tax=Ascidiaceihabitans donghaensis TaxID=1510460 RepID=A0A2R8BFU0_9RHOB|nr:hypothetical protein [Ascidiaceihabitans donghaensis]SPH21988.1 hypothetical protein ASD8599_02735 [Ascidiaceihabitans donghaensis]